MLAAVVRFHHTEGSTELREERSGQDGRLRTRTLAPPQRALREDLERLCHPRHWGICASCLPWTLREYLDAAEIRANTQSRMLWQRRRHRLALLVRTQYRPLTPGTAQPLLAYLEVLMSMFEGLG